MRDYEGALTPHQKGHSPVCSECNTFKNSEIFFLKDEILGCLLKWSVIGKFKENKNWVDSFPSRERDGMIFFHRNLLSSLGGFQQNLLSFAYNCFLWEARQVSLEHTRFLSLKLSCMKVKDISWCKRNITFRLWHNPAKALWMLRFVLRVSFVNMEQKGLALGLSPAVTALKLLIIVKKSPTLLFCTWSWKLCGQSYVYWLNICWNVGIRDTGGSQAKGL